MTQQNNSKEIELQNLLADERKRCSQHKQLYQTLKEEHGKLKDELTLIHQQLQERKLEHEQMKELKDNYIKKLEQQLREKQKELSRSLDEVKSFDPKKVRDSVLEEAINHYELKIKELIAEANESREQYHTLHRDHTALKCKLESRESEYSHSLQRHKVQHLSELEELKSKIESLEKDKSFPDDTTAMDLKSAKHEILQLNSKLSGLLAECEELRAKNETLSLQLNNTNRTHSKQTSDYVSNIRSLESEKQKVIMQKEVLEKQLSDFQDQRRHLNSDLQSSRREILSLKSKLEECEHKCQMIKTDLQVENEHLKTEYQSDRELLIDEITRLKSELKDATMELDHIKQILISKEQELQQNAMFLRQQLWKQSTEFQQEREKMERKFQDLKSQKDYLISQLNQEVQMLQRDLQLYSESKLELEKELFSTKEKLEAAAKNTDAVVVTTLSKQNLDYEKEIQRLQEDINMLKSNSNVHPQEKDRLLSDILSRHKEKNYEEDREVLQLKLDWEQQKHQFHLRIEDLEAQLKEIKNASVAERKELDLKIQRYSRAVNKLKDKLELQKVKNEELETQKEVLEKNVPYEIYLQVRNRLTELQRRLEEYRLIVAAEPHISANTRTSVPQVSDKLLTDIKNLQIRLPPAGDAALEYEALKFGREKMHALHPKKPHTRRKSLRTRSRDQSAKAISPVITSSSDIDLENL